MIFMNNSDELYHYGVKGMRWGHRKASYSNTAVSTLRSTKGMKRPSHTLNPNNDTAQRAAKNGNSILRQQYLDAKANKKAANKAYTKAFNKAYNRNFAMLSPVKKHRDANNDRWNDAAEKGAKSYEADKAFKQVKKERKAAIKSTYKQLNKEASFKDKLLYNDATRKQAAKYVVDNGMSVAEATKKANNVAKRNTAIVLGAYGAVAVGTYLKSRS